MPAHISPHFFETPQDEQKELKSDIIRLKKKGNCHPVLAIKKKKELLKKDTNCLQAQTEKISKKKTNSKHLTRVDFPQTCRDFNG